MLAKAKQSLSRFLTALHHDNAGAMAVEKILLLALIALPIIIALFAFRRRILGWFNDQSSQLNP